VFDGVDDGLVGQVRAAAFRRHEASLSLVALDRVVVQGSRTLRNARGPCPLVAKLRRTATLSTVTRDAAML
jgi:hypothetical protein